MVRNHHPNLRAVVLAAACLAFVVIGLGAYVRLSDAGLGCPDWPGCYGQVTPHHAAEAIAAAQASMPDGPVTPAKAWKEMLHRYLASTLGFLIVLIGALAWGQGRGPARRLAISLVGLVVVQGLLGMWTVTRALQPTIVSLHLLGGMATLALLVWLATHFAGGTGRHPMPTMPVALAGLALCLLLLQIALGGWVSSHGAALACADFPTCGGRWWPDADWSAAFRLDSAVGQAADVPGVDALVAMHWAHRLGAVLASLAVAGLAWSLWRQPAFAGAARWLVALLVGQLVLGASNVLTGLPLSVAVAHNLGAAGLLIALTWVNARLRRTP
jgi:cytochrome c oxidase assembly protein subunit 15